MADLRHLFTIGEFSRISGITVKALRFYHEQGLLVPSHVDPQTGYRYYDPALAERARAIVQLRDLKFPLEQIAQILRDASDESQIMSAMKAHRAAIAGQQRELRDVIASLDQFISQYAEEKTMSAEQFEVQEKTVDAMVIAGIRMKGRYDECGKGFAKIYRALGRLVAGPAMMLHYDSEYKETDADFEAAMPVKQSEQVAGIDVRELPAARCVCLMYQGPYDQIGPSYARVFKYVKEKSYNVILPTREIYLKGPGMIFKGNPKKYLTEIQIPLAPAS